MSDPVTNIEIEDVLSSIRRLVAETERAQERAPERPVQTPDRLVLSPALRVADPVLRLPPRDSDAEAEQVLQRAVHPPVAARAAVLEAALADGADDWEPDGSETRPVIDWSPPPVPTDVSPDVVSDVPADTTAVMQTEDLQPKAEGQSAATFEDDLADHMDRTISVALADRIAGMGAAQGLDEAVLRAMVVDVVRDELQGALGERITRNVRKLVRREIFRVLSSHDPD